ncbi:hypothetical protein G7078_08965 [Sphingomonas sinipercae]|uniref:Uncharacterized protein n=1 Tax=Sphingomonas sinipercae TaxID=2714944 RepID=A0A6G7ZPK4_9SPHN|nr:hypothetical protein [Sphingomonas sinipercae]QIL02901.1 hypothetical protein G7078_08965 [Sphingomonas sinipercae]
MILFFPLIPMLFGAAAAPDWFPRVRMSFVQDEMVLRIPARPPVANGQSQWKERKGPKCISGEKLRGAVLSGSDQVDFILQDRKRVRARLDSNCPALDFYEDFYLSSRDGKICVRRDAIRSRMGGTCTIRKFRKLVPVKGQIP